MSDLQRAFDHFKDVSDVYTEYFHYYDGDQPLRYSTKRLEEAFNQIRPRFRQNWCAVVINAVLERMEMYGFSAADERISNALADYWTGSGLALEANEVHESALVAGEAFLIGWQDEGAPLEFYYNDPRRCAVFYNEDRPKVKDVAVKWWNASDGCHMMLYYADRLEHYLAYGKQMAELDGMTKADTAFAFIEATANPYGIIPVFHFRNSLRKVCGDIYKSDLKNVTELQDAINKLLCDMMVTAEFSAFPARYVISAADIEQLNNAPNQIWDLPASLEGQQNTQVGTLEAANLANYSGQIEALAQSIATITNTPKHYFDKTGANISGEALITMEAPLVKKVNLKRELFGDVWQEVGAFIAAVLGYTVRKYDIVPQWGQAEAEQPLTETEIIRNYRAAGLPLKTALRLTGYTDAEVAIVEEEVAEEKQTQNDLADLYLQQARDASAQENRI